MPRPLLAALRDLPRPADTGQVRVARERLANTVLAPLLDEPAAAPLIDTLAGNSPFLTECMLAEPGAFMALLDDGPDIRMAALLAEAAQPGDDLARRLRRIRRAVALTVAVADIGGLWTLEQVTGALTEFAEVAVRAALDHLLRAAGQRGDLALAHPDEPARDSGLFILGMGKLGGRELNYSSDIDLIVFYEAEMIHATGSRDAQEVMVRLVRDLVRVLEERTADGYVFRTDLRLRPDPGATPVALSTLAAEHYYEAQGQNWERAAMIKARPIAGDLATGEAFLRRLAPFIWRRNLDFAAIDDIQSIKRQIHAHKGHAEIAVPGHDVKLGRGGIREIEFFAQTQQLIAGGRDPRLRVRATCDALRALTETGRVTPRARDELIVCYGELRRVEHRLQMIADEQTHKLPADPAKLAHAAVFLGAADLPTFSAAFMETLRTVTRHFDALFATAAPLGASGALIFTGTEDDPATLQTLKGLGFTDPGMVSGVIRRWHHGRYPVMRSARARELLTALKPRLLQALAHAAQPDEAILNFDRFLSRLPAAVQLFALLRSNPDLLDLLSDILGTAPRLAEHLARQPRLVEAMLEHRAYAAEDLALAIADLDRQVRDADLQVGLEALRRFKGELEFRIGVAWLKRECDVDVAARALSAVADTVLARVLDLAAADFARNHGRIAGGAMAVVALGKLGGREMAFGSDLDLIFVYDHPAETEQSDGRSPLSPGLYFARLSQRCITALTSLSGEGRLYEVDMRLRPSGNAGPVAVSLDRFASYNLGEAWTWEHMALTRARPVAGPATLQARIVDAVTAALTGSRDADKLRTDVLDMHRRTMEVHGSNDPWNIKHARGGLMDCEFIAQYLVLAGAQADPTLVTGNTAHVFDHLRLADLAGLTRFLRTLQTTLRLCIDGAPDPTLFPPGLQALLAAHGGVADLATLAAKLSGAQAAVRDRFAELVGPAVPR